MDLNLANKLALVSGSTAGIGFSIAETLVAEGARRRIVHQRVLHRDGRDVHRIPSPRATRPRSTSRVPPRSSHEGA